MTYNDLNKSGIYAITHVTSGRVYIGSAVNINRRWTVHLCILKKGTHHAPYLQRSWNKHGPEAFKICVLEYVPDATKLIEREQHWLDRINPTDCTKGYNVSPTARSRLGAKGQVISEAHRKAISAAHKGKVVSQETRAKLSAAMAVRSYRPPKGIKRSAETCAKISLNSRGRKHSDETKFKMAEAKKGKPRSAEAIAATAAGHVGLKRSEETRARISLAQKGRKRSPEAVANMREAWKIRRENYTRNPVTIEQKARISAGRKAAIAAKLANKRVDQLSFL